jgi:hypothetical protein
MPVLSIAATAITRIVRIDITFSPILFESSVPDRRSTVRGTNQRLNRSRLHGTKDDALLDLIKGYSQPLDDLAE